MTIKQRNKGYEASLSKDGQRFRRTFSTYEEAEQWEAKIRLALIEGRDPNNLTVRGGTWSLDEAVSATYKAIWAGSKSEETSYKNSTAAISFFGKNQSLSAITTVELQEWVQHLRELGNSNATINRKLAALSRVLTYSHQCNRLSSVPHIPRQREAVSRLRWATYQEEQIMLDLCDSWSIPDVKDLLIILLDTGMRVGEVLKLTAQDAFADRVVIVDPKNGKTHAVPLTSRASEIISKRLLEAPKGALFPITYTSAQWHFKKITEHMGLDDVSIHTLRHTFASRLVQKGVSLQVVSKLLNHSTLTMTMRYAHLAPMNYTDAISVLESGNVGGN